MAYQPASNNSFETIHHRLTTTTAKETNSDTINEPSLILAYTDPTCNNIFLYQINSRDHLTSVSDYTEPQFIGVSGSKNPYFQSKPLPSNNQDEGYYRQPQKSESHVPVLVSTLSTHGLLCLITRRSLAHGSARSEYNIRIINPVTRHSIELPSAKPGQFREWLGHGIGFIKQTNEHKLVRLSHSHSFQTNNKKNPHPECRPYHLSGSSVNVVEILSLKNVDQGWRSILVDCHNIPWSNPVNPVSVSGSLHWMIHNKPKPPPPQPSNNNGRGRRYANQNEDNSDSDVDPRYQAESTDRIDYSALLIARFDLQGSNLVKYAGPPVTGGSGGYDPSGLGPKLMELKGCLSLVVDMGYSMDIWMMKEYGVQESWEKHVSMSLNICVTNPPHVLSMLEDGQVLILRSEQLLEVYEPKTKAYKMFRLATVADMAHAAVIYPSLASVGST